MTYVNRKVIVDAQGWVGVLPSLLPSAALGGVRVFHAGARPEARLVYLAGAQHCRQ